MVSSRIVFISPLLLLFCCVSLFGAEPTGSIRGMVYDKDFEAPMPSAKVTIAKTGQTIESGDEGNYILSEVEPGTYTLVFSKEGYVRQVKSDVVVSSGKMTEVDAWLSGDFTDMEEFVVQDVQLGTGTEAALLELRMESPALMDSVSADLMSQAGASDAASALKLVSGATVQDGKYATIRGLPDRYVNSQMNSVRLPTADSDKRAVQLDQFPSAVIESIQVTKTFTPDQQGDASGGAVNLVLKGIPDERVLSVSTGTSYNTQVEDADPFLSYEGGGVDKWGTETIDPQIDSLNQSWDGAIGVSPADAQTAYKWSVAMGDKFQLTDDIKVGGFGSFFYERDSSFYDNGKNDKYWVQGIDLRDGDSPYEMIPYYSGGNPTETSENDYMDWNTSLFDVTKASQSVQWGGLGAVGLETENHEINLLYMYTRDAVDKVTLAENIRGRESLHIYWPEIYPELDFNEPLPPDFNRNASPPLRNQTLEYTERTTETLQLSGNHKFDLPQLNLRNWFSFDRIEMDWMVARSESTLYQPDKRLFSAEWWPWPIGDGRYLSSPFGGDEGTSGWLYRSWKDISETSDQYYANWKLPFEQWSGDEGYFKFGIFNDQVSRTYEQDTYLNLGDSNWWAAGSWDEDWSQIWQDENHPIKEFPFDVGYDGQQNISAWYSMMDLPLNSYFNLIGGARFESTELSIVNHPDIGPSGDPSAKLYYWNWTDEGNLSINYANFNREDSDVDFKQTDVLPSIGFDYRPFEKFSVRGSYSQTVARQTFKELSPIAQQEYVGGDKFVGNPALQMSSLDNYDLRFDFTPYQGGLLSFSYFHKDVKNPIEYVQIDDGTHDFISVVNYPEGEIDGFEFEIRQQMGQFFDSLNGLSLGANATIIDSQVTLLDAQVQSMENYGAPAERVRNMTNAPEHLYNIFFTYDIRSLGTQLGLFYTVRGDTLIAGAGASAKGYVPDVYEKEYGTLNFSLSQKLGENWKLKFQAKNLFNPAIETYYKSDDIVGDVTKTSYKKGIEFSVSLGAKF